jgi:hypothetical protein
VANGTGFNCTLTGTGGSMTSSSAMSVGVGLPASSYVGNAYGGISEVVSYNGGSAGSAFGLYGRVSRVNSTGAFSAGYGVYGKAQHGTTRYGVRGDVTDDNSAEGQTWYGVYGSVADPGDQEEEEPPYPINAYAVYGTATTRDPYALPLTGTNTNSYAGWFNGHVWVNGIFGSSDARLKKDIKPLGKTLDLIKKLEGVSYEFDHAKHPSLNLPYGKQLGLLAQDLEKVFPELVTNTTFPGENDSDGKPIEPAFDIKGVNYLGLIPVLISGMQEQQALIEDKQSQIEVLTARLDKLESVMTGEGKQGALTPNGAKAQLFQNQPNPFGENTVIRYSLPESTSKASIEVLSESGQVVKAFNDLGSGNGQLMITAGSLAAGSYTYTLVLNGERSDSKTMVITR